MFGKKRKPFDPAMIDKAKLQSAPAFAMNETPLATVGDVSGMGYNAPTVKQPGPKFFGDGGLGWRLLGAIGDVWGSGEPTYAPRLEDERKLSLLQQRQEAENAQWYAREQWKAQNTPKSPYRWEANDGSLMEVGPDGQPRVVYQDPTPKTQWVRVDNGNGTFTMTPMGPQGSPAPTAPKGKLKPYGGPTAPQSGGFPR